MQNGENGTPTQTSRFFPLDFVVDQLDYNKKACFIRHYWIFSEMFYLDERQHATMICLQHAAPNDEISEGKEPSWQLVAIKRATLL